MHAVAVKQPCSLACWQPVCFRTCGRTCAQVDWKVAMRPPRRGGTAPLGLSSLLSLGDGNGGSAYAAAAQVPPAHPSRDRCGIPTHSRAPACALCSLLKPVAAVRMCLAAQTALAAAQAAGACVSGAAADGEGGCSAAAAGTASIIPFARASLSSELLTAPCEGRRLHCSGDWRLCSVAQPVGITGVDMIAG